MADNSGWWETSIVVAQYPWNTSDAKQFSRWAVEMSVPPACHKVLWHQTAKALIAVQTVSDFPL
tara:strand:- start:99 stop:290 length:192 start_codon:yes stop_codon:yes gene_type:complete